MSHFFLKFVLCKNMTFSNSALYLEIRQENISSLLLSVWLCGYALNRFHSDTILNTFLDYWPVCDIVLLSCALPFALVINGI